MPVRVDITPPPPANSKQPGVTKSLLYNGSKFQGYQKSKGNSYEVEVILQVRKKPFYFFTTKIALLFFVLLLKTFFIQNFHVYITIILYLFLEN